MAYGTVSALKARLNITDTVDDSVLTDALNAAAVQIDNWCGWRFTQDSAVQARTFWADDPYCLRLVDDENGDGISTLTGLIVKTDDNGTGVFGTTWTIDTHFTVQPANALTRTPAWPYIELVAVGDYVFPRWARRRGVQVTAKFGWPAVPDDVTAAALMLAADIFKSKDTQFGVAGTSDFGVVRVSANSTARQLLAPYRKPAVG